MVNWIKNLTIRRFYLLKLWRNKKDSYLYQSGWIKSFQQKKPVNLKGEPIPWLSLPLVHFLKDKLNPTQSVFEYGSGHSTIFFASRTNKVVSIEYDKYWFDIISKQIYNTNSTMHYFDYRSNDYASSIKNISDEKYDIILIDGRNRVKCCTYSINSLSDIGVVILDDSNRHRYSEGIKIFQDNGFKCLDFWGLGPGSIGKKCTSIYYKNNNCLGI